MIAQYSHKTRKRFPGAVAAAQAKSLKDWQRETISVKHFTPDHAACEVCSEEARFHPQHPTQTHLRILCTGELIKLRGDIRAD
jgi:hypothetical protein